MRIYCNNFQNYIRRRTEFCTFEEKQLIQQQLYPAFVSILCDKAKSYTCLKGTEFLLALLSDWREKLNIFKKIVTILMIILIDIMLLKYILINKNNATKYKRNGKLCKS